MKKNSVHQVTPSTHTIAARVLAVITILSLLTAGCDMGTQANSSLIAPTYTPGADQILPGAGTLAPDSTAVAPTITTTAAPGAGTSPAASSSTTQAPAGNPGGASPVALAYLNYAVDYIQQHGLDSDKVDWPAVRAKVFGPDLKAQTTADTYPAIEYVLGQLPVNHHSFLIRPDSAKSESTSLAEDLGLRLSYAERRVVKVDPGSPADKAGVRSGDTIVTVNDSPVETLGAMNFFAQIYFGSSVKLGLQHAESHGGTPMTAQINHDPVDPTALIQGRRLSGNIGYIELPALGATPVFTYYADIAQQIIQDIDRTPTCGWVVDLQGNTGGSSWGMLEGIAPVLGEGLLGYFTGPDGKTPWTYSNGKALLGETVIWQVDKPYHTQHTNPPVAVLTDGQTASAAESVLIAFRGRPNTRSFGEPTWGVPTGNVEVPLSDGAMLVLTEVRMADRTSKVYDGKIAPDSPVTADSFYRGTDKDSVMQAGVAWLQQQPACANQK